MNDMTQAYAKRFDPSDLLRGSSGAFRMIANCCHSLLGTTWRYIVQLLSSIEGVRKFSLNIAIVSGVILGTLVVGKASLKSYVTIDPINVPKSLADRGFTGDVVAQRIYDELNEIGRLSKLKRPLGEFSTFSFDRTLPKIDLPIGGVSLATVVTSARDLFGLIDTRIGGEVIVEDDDPKKKYSLRLRVTDRGAVYRQAEPSDDLNKLFYLAALQVVERFDPHIAAAYYFARDDYDNALRMIHQSLSDSSIGNDAVVLNLRGMIAKNQKRYDDALAQFRDVQKRFPDYVAAQHNIAATLILKEQYGSALREAMIGIQIDPKRSQGYVNAGSAHYSMHALGEALAFFRTASEISPNEAIGYINQAAVYRALQKPDHKEAIKLYRRAADADPHDERTFIQWGTLAQEQGDNRQARLLFERAIDAKPKSPVGYKRLGALLADEQNWVGAEKAIRNALALGGDRSKSLHYNLGRALQGTGRYDEAIAEYERVIALDERFALAYVKQAASLVLKLRQAQAEPNGDPSKPAGEQTLDAEEVMEDVNDLLAQVKKIGEPDASVLRELGRLYEIMDKKEQAVEFYQAAMAADGERNAGLKADIARLGRRLASY